jgi:hypothetical protein
MRFSLIIVGLLIASCGVSNNTIHGDGSGTGGTPDSGTGSVGDSGMTTSDGDTVGSGGAITCPGPGNPKHNGGSCGSERWTIKTGTDSHASSMSLVPKPTTIAALVALAAAGAGNSRQVPTESTLWEIKDVTLTQLKAESDSDYHLVISDGAHTMIAEVPYPSCATGSTWLCFMSRARSEVDAIYTVTTSPQYPSVMVTLRGVGFFDFLHSQNGVAPNGIELHPVLQICFGHGCTPA